MWGPTLRVQQEVGEVLFTHSRLSTRSLKTIFGPVEIVRMGYSRVGAPSIYPLDQTLALPRVFVLLRTAATLGQAAMQNPFQESVAAIADLTGVSVPKRSLEPPTNRGWMLMYTYLSIAPAIRNPP
jgi:hypothetical protein